MATPLYVNPAAANDTGDGTTPALAKKTIDAAYNAVDDGGEVLLLAGTYDATTQGAGWLLSLDEDKGVAVKPDPDTAPAITLTTAGASRQIYFAAGAAGKTVRVEGVTIVPAAGTRIATMESTFYGAAEIVDCTLTCGALNFSFVAGTATRSVLIDGCTITTSAESWILNANNLASLRFTDNTITSTSTSTSTTVGLIYTGGAVGTVEITGNTVTVPNIFFVTSTSTVFSSLLVADNTISWTPTANAQRLIYTTETLTTAGKVSVIGNTISIAATAFTPLYAISIGNSSAIATAKAYNYPIVIGNRIAHATSGFNYGIAVSAGCVSPKILYNDLTGFSNSIYVNGCFDATIDSNYINGGQNGINLIGGGRHTVTHNHVLGNDYGGGAEVSRCAITTRLLKAQSTATTTFAATTVTDGGGSAWGGAQANIVAGLIAMVNSGTGWFEPLQWARVVSIDGDEVTVDGWKDFDDSDAAQTPTNGHVCVILEFPLGCVITDNVFDATNGSFGINFDFIPDDPKVYCDRNLYHPGTSTLSNLASQRVGVSHTLAELQAAWASQSVTHPENDANSQEISYLTQRYIDSTRWWKMPGWTSRIAGRRRPLLIP